MPRIPDETVDYVTLLAMATVDLNLLTALDALLAEGRGNTNGPVDQALAALGLRRAILAVVPGFSAALAIAKASDLVVRIRHLMPCRTGRRRARIDPLLPFKFAPMKGGEASQAGVPRRKPRIRPTPCGRSSRLCS